MPTYDYKCATCGRGREIVKPIAELDRTEHCLNCGFAMNRQLSAPRVIGDYPGYRCPVTDKWIEGRAAHEENLKRTGCRVFEPGERECAQRDRRQAEERMLDSVGETAEAFVHNLPTRKREALISEIESGADASITRTSPSNS